jgi:hypothetical protein
LFDSAGLSAHEQPTDKVEDVEILARLDQLHAKLETLLQERATAGERNNAGSSS